ncbi:MULTISPECIES: CaiB/BaiF CoA transferase family protein [Paenibacillus]|uniref:CaiB/BaiF CoA transferase family protein n=1 Tax=Paenibacillus TaxID=44249 RepID=UPI0001AFD96E|nr:MULTISPECIES: CaiB/BaiF CoA-transferase family protein [unclassified Paenibacillus]EES72589.1 CoA-transferase family III protein [Paenibacillus sp. oral taxon 786 str. D14]OXL87508.1 carnitine dehydratase [Paenibacillus sp. SSG-1]
MIPRPLEGLLVLDFSQFLSGPYAGLRLADLGARVIKIERLDGGDICRRLYISNMELDGDSTLFHSINRNKESYAVDLKSESDRHKVRKLLSHADIMIQNFRPGVIEKLGFGYEEVKAINPFLIYGSISGYGWDTPLRGRPGQDLLMQAFTGLSWLNRDDAIHRPIPFGLAIADMMTGAHLVQGILAALVRRSVQGTGALVEVNMLESTLDVMQEIWDEKWMPDRCSNEGAGEAESSRWLKGLYPTATGYIALEEMSLYELKKALEAHFSSATINEVTADSIQQLLLTKPADYWCIQLRKAGIACEELLNWEQLLGQEAFRDLNITQNIYRSNGARLTALSCPIRLNGYRLQSSRGAPYIGEHNGAIELEWLSHS